MAPGYGLNPAQYRTFSSWHKIVTMLLLALLVLLWLLGYGPNAYRNCASGTSLQADASLGAPPVMAPSMPSTSSMPPNAATTAPPMSASPEATITAPVTSSLPAASPADTASSVTTTPASESTAPSPDVAAPAATAALSPPTVATKQSVTKQDAKTPNTAVYFAAGKSKLSLDGSRRLAKIVAYLKANPDAKVVVSGFHDRSGSRARNITLAKDRAEAVKRALEKAGIAAARITSEKPRDTTGTGRSKDARRVEIKVR